MIFYEIFMLQGLFLTPFLWVSTLHSSSFRERSVARESCREGVNVLDVFFLIVTGVFFAGCLAYIVGCERL
jgi:hypothetical protein